MTDPAPSSGALFRLRDLLDQHELGLQPLVEPEGAADRRVSGVHGVETERPARWLAPDWVLLTIGVRLVGDEDAQRRLPGELAEAGVTALGFGRGLDFDDVPAPLLEAAEEAGLPVFAVPIQTPFREIETFVHRALVSSELRTLQRSSSMQRYLVDALHGPEPRRALVGRLATLLEADVAVLRADGSTEESAGDAPADVRGLLVEPTRGARDVDAAGRRGTLAPIAADPDDPEDRWLLVTAADRPGGRRLVRPAVGVATPLLAAVGRLDATARAHEDALCRGLLRDLVAGPVDARDVAARAAALGVDLEAPFSVVVVGPAEDDRGPVDDGRDAADGDRDARDVARALRTHGLRPLVSRDRGRVAALVPGASVPDEALLRALTGAPGRAAGIGRPGTGAAHAARSARDAHVAADAAARAGVDGRPWRAYADLELPALVVGQLPADRVDPQVRAALGALDARPGSRDALRALFAHELDVAAAARALHLHPNSLRYRLNRLADDLGRSLRDPTTIATLVLALEIERRAGGPGAAEAAADDGA